MYSRFLLAMVPLLLTSPVFAVDCENASDPSTMSQCAAQQHAAADKELNALYQQITSRLKSNPDSQKDPVAGSDVQAVLEVSGG